MVDGEEHRFIDVENEMCFYLNFAIKCCCCQSDPVGSIDNATRKSTKFISAMKSFSLTQKNGAGHWMALTCGPSTIDFVLGKIEERIKYFLRVNELRCSFYCGKQRHHWIGNCESQAKREVDRLGLSLQDRTQSLQISSTTFRIKMECLISG